MILPNIDKKSKRDPDYFLYLESIKLEDGAGKVKAPDKTKKRISARNLFEDIRKGSSDPELRKKYQVSQRDLHIMFGKLVGVGRLTQSDIDERRKPLMPYICPKCDIAFGERFEECPKCRTILMKSY